MARQKQFLRYKGVTLYEAKKGSRTYSPFYALLPNQQVEGMDPTFDLRLLPRKYRNGINIELDTSMENALTPDGILYRTDKVKEAYEKQDNAYMEVLRRAIDDNYDFDAASRGLYGQYFRRIIKWFRMRVIKRAGTT